MSSRTVIASVGRHGWVFVVGVLIREFGFATDHWVFVKIINEEAMVKCFFRSSDEKIALLPPRATIPFLLMGVARHGCSYIPNTTNTMDRTIFAVILLLTIEVPTSYYYLRAALPSPIIDSYPELL
jgi:hypothetical protein